MPSEHHELHGADEDLAARWQRLDIQRFTGRPLNGGEAGTPEKSHLAEYQALSDLLAAAFTRASRPSLVRSALANLDKAYSDAHSADSVTARHRVSGRRLYECLRAYRTLPTGTVPLSSLDLAARQASEELKSSAEPAQSAEVLLLRCALGEFFKETYTSQLIQGAVDLSHFEIVGSADEVDQLLLASAFETLAPVKGLIDSGEIIDRYDSILAATCIRHLAVVHEFYSSRGDCPREQRTEHIHEWLRLSADAAAVCADQDEFNTQAYALINKSAAMAELTAADPADSQMRTLEENSEDVQSAQSLFELTGDDRGVAWSSIHLARIRARRYELGERSASIAELTDTLLSMLEASIDAVSNSRRIDDEVALGLASLYLCAAEKEAHRLGLSELAISDEREIAERARYAAKVLSSTHRLQQAARALQIAAQCELVTASETDDAGATSASQIRAMGDLTDAVALLDENGSIDRTTLDRLIGNLHDSVAGAVPRWRF